MPAGSMENSSQPSSSFPKKPGPAAIEAWLSLKQEEEPKLLEMLHEIELRIGTATELPDDVEKVRAIVHQLNNLRTARQLRHDLDQTKE